MANTFHYPCIYHHHISHSFTHVPHLFLHYSHRWIYCILCVTIKFHRKHHQMQNLLLGDLWVDYCHYIGNSRRVIKSVAPISDPLLTICYPVGDFHRGDPYWICQLHLPPRAWSPWAVCINETSFTAMLSTAFWGPYWGSITLLWTAGRNGAWFMPTASKGNFVFISHPSFYEWTDFNLLQITINRIIRPADIAACNILVPRCDVKFQWFIYVWRTCR